MEILYLKRLVLDREMTVESTLHTLLVAKDFREHLPSCSMSYVSGMPDTAVFQYYCV